MPNPRVAEPRVVERAPWRSTKRGVAGVCSLLEMPTDSCHFPCTSDTPVRPQNSLTRKALSATRGLASGGLGTRQLSSTGAGVWRKAPTAFPDSSPVLLFLGVFDFLVFFGKFIKDFFKKVWVLEALLQIYQGFLDKWGGFTKESLLKCQFTKEKHPR